MTLEILTDKMYERKTLFKACRIPTIAESLAQRSKKVIAERQIKQREVFQSKRAVSPISSVEKSKPKEKKKNTMAERLKKWKEEKIKKLESVKKTQKPPFKVGILQRKVTGSPLLINKNAFSNKKLTVSKENIAKCFEQKSGVVTRSQAELLNINIAQLQLQVVRPNKLKNQFCKIDNNKRKPFTSTEFRVPESVTQLANEFISTPPFSNSVKETNSFVIQTENNDLGGKSKKGILTEAESIKDVKVLNTPPGEKDDYKPIYFSPFVTVRSKRKSLKKKSLSLDVDELIEKEEKEFQCRIFSFRKYIQCESKRLLDLSNKWKCIYLEYPEIPKEIEGDIDCIVGKTHLLTSDKFKQFKDLIDKCEKGDPMIKIDDLQGFQDWVSIEVERIDEEFYKLEQRKCNNWCTPPLKEAVKEKKIATKERKKKVKRSSCKSTIRSHILEARKLLKEKNIDGGEVKICEPVEIVTLEKKESLLRDVLLSETKKNNFLTGVDEHSMQLRSKSKSEVPTTLRKRKSVSKSPKSVKKGSSVKAKENQTPGRSILKKTSRSGKFSKTHVTFDVLPDNQKSSKKGLDEKYFKPALDNEESPFRLVLGDMRNTPKISTKSSRRLNF